MPSNWATRPMSAGERRLWRKLKTQAALLSPAMQAAIERSFDAVRLSLSVAEMTALLETTRSEAFVTALLSDAEINKSFNPARARLIATTEAATNGFIRDLPGGLVATSGFNVLDPRVLEAIDKLDTRVMKFLRSDIRETMRATYRAGIEKGLDPAAIARQIRSTIGLAPNQFQQIANFRQALEDGDIKKAFKYTLRDKRFDRTLAKLAQGTPPNAAQIDKMTAAYQRRRMVSNAKIHARTAVNDSQRLGKHLATEAGIASGALPPADQMRSRWSSSGDGRVRPSHVDAHGEVVRFGEPFSTGDVIPGASEWMCRCIKIDFVARPKSATTPKKKAKVPPPTPPAKKPSSGFFFPIENVVAAPVKKAPGLTRVTSKTPDFSFASEVAPEITKLPIEAQRLISDGINTVLSRLGGRVQFLGMSGKTAKARLGWTYPSQANAVYGHNPFTNAPGSILFKAKYVRNAASQHADSVAHTVAQNERIRLGTIRARDQPGIGASGKAKLQERLDELVDHPPRWTVGQLGPGPDALFSTAAHEAAHASYFQGGLATRWEAAVSGISDRIKRRVSTYGATDPSELFAETTAAIAQGHTALLPPEIVAAWEKVTKLQA